MIGLEASSRNQLRKVSKTCPTQSPAFRLYLRGKRVGNVGRTRRSFTFPRCRWATTARSVARRVATIRSRERSNRLRTNWHQQGNSPSKRPPQPTLASLARDCFQSRRTRASCQVCGASTPILHLPTKLLGHYALRAAQCARRRRVIDAHRRPVRCLAVRAHVAHVAS